MPVSATVLFDTPQRELASLLRNRLSTSVRTQIVAGFATVEGMAAIEAPLSANPGTLDSFIVGAGTYRAFEALDRLLTFGVQPNRLFVHLGHTRPTGSTAKHRFYRYHPMLHSKVYYMEHSDGTASAIVGSHNVTGFALLGLNGEAAVLLEGERTSPEFEKIRNHIASAQAQSLTYSPDMKQAFAWWTHQFIEGLADKANDLPREGEGKRTIVILCECPAGLPKRNDRIYFELRAALGKVQSLRAEVHIYVFDTLPATPHAGLAALDTARASFWCRTIGLEEARGGVELRADWYLDDDMHPILRSTPKPFRPTPSSDMQQVRVQVYNQVQGKFEYLFDPPATGWIPDVDHETSIQVPSEHREHLAALELIPPEHQQWFLVKGLRSADRPADNGYLLALEHMSPEAGSYVLMSLRRREINPDEEGDI